MQADRSNQKEGKAGISSLELGLTILEQISDNPAPITLTELSEQVSISPSRLHKYLVSLVRMGYITQQNDHRYALSTSSLKLGITALRLIDPIKLAFSTAEKLHQQHDKTISLTIWAGEAPLVIKWLDSSYPLPVNVRLGSQLSPFTSASGRIFLAFLPEHRKVEIIEQFYAALPPPPRHMGKKLDKGAFIALLEQIRAEKVCRFQQDFLPDINVVSAPVFDIDNNISSVINLLGSSNDTPVDKGSFYEQLITEACQATTRKIQGYC